MPIRKNKQTAAEKAKEKAKILLNKDYIIIPRKLKSPLTLGFHPTKAKAYFGQLRCDIS